MFFLYKIPKQNLCFFEFLFFCFVRDGKSTCKSGSLGEAPCRVSYMNFWTLGLKQARPKNLPKKWKNFGTGSRRGATPGRLGAQNRWLLKGFLPEGRLHRTCGRDRLGAHFAWSLLKKSQMSIEVFVIRPTFFLPLLSINDHICSETPLECF